MLSNKSLLACVVAILTCKVRGIKSLKQPFFIVEKGAGVFFLTSFLGVNFYVLYRKLCKNMDF